METIFTDGQLTKLIETMRQKKMTPDRFNALLGSGILADVLDSEAHLDNRDAVRQALKLGTMLPEQLILSVDYSQSLEQMIAAGRYDWVNGDITAKRFPVVGEGVVQYETKLFHFNCVMSSEQASEAIRSADTTNPWELGKIEHLCALGAKYPKEQSKYPIIGLGSSGEVRGNRIVPCLHGGDSERRLSLTWWVGGWDDDFRFLAVRKVSDS